MALSPYFFVDSDNCTTDSNVDLIGIPTGKVRRMLSIMANTLREAKQIVQTYCHRDLLGDFALLTISSGLTYNVDAGGHYLTGTGLFATIDSALEKGKVITMSGGTGATSGTKVYILSKDSDDKVYISAAVGTAAATDFTCTISGGAGYTNINWTDIPVAATGLGNELAVVAGHPLVPDVGCRFDGASPGTSLAKGADYQANQPGPCMMLKFSAA